MSKKQSHHNYDKYKRDQESKAFYNSKAWKKKRPIILKRDHYLCQYCLQRKTITPADVVHHIKELKDYPELALEDENLISLCHTCHNYEHPDKSRRKKKQKRKPDVVKFKANPDII